MCPRLFGSGLEGISAVLQCHLCEAKGGEREEKKERKTPEVALDDGSADAQCRANHSARICSPRRDSILVERRMRQDERAW